MKNKISLKMAIVIPVLILVTIISSLFIGLWKKDYEILASKQSNKIINMLITNTKINLSNFIKEASKITKIAKEEVEYNKYYNENNLKKIEKYINRLMSLTSDAPQISVIGYSDERKNFIGIRNNYNGENSLMLKDSRTNNKLNIYENASINSKLLNSFDGYDPTTRPFYVPIKEKLKPIWTDVYINYDEIMEATITNNRPIFDNGRLVGGVLADVKLTGINKFLRKEKESENAYIYILDDKDNILAHTGKEDVIKLIKIKNSEPKGELINAYEIDNPIIVDSYKYLNVKNKYNQIIKEKINNENYYILQSKWDEIKELSWKIVVAIPESDLIRGLKKRHNDYVIYMIVFTIFTILLLFYFLNKITHLILKNADYASQIASGNLELNFDNRVVPIYEINKLEESLKTMSLNLKKSFIEIKRSESKYRLLVENLDQMIFSLDKDNRVLTTNKSFLNAIGKTKELTIGKKFDEIVVEIDKNNFWRDIINKVKKDKLLVKSMHVYVDDKGEKKILDVTILPLLSKSKEIMMILGSSLDMTELISAQERINEMSKNETKRLKSEVKKRTKALEIARDELIEQEKLASLGSLVSGVAHEINTPLGIAVTSSSYIKKINNSLINEIDSGELSKESFLRKIGNISETIETLDINLGRASNLIKNFKKISVNQSNDSKIEFRIIEYLDAVVTSLKHEFKNTNYKIHINCDDELSIKSYPGVYSQIFTNFLMNSKIHGFKDLDDGDIYIDIRKEEEELLIEYKDNGHGISDHIIKDVFDPFFTTNRENGGSGLGLSIVYNLVTGKLNGKIKCVSNENEGAIFKIKLNLNDESRK